MEAIGPYSLQDKHSLVTANSSLVSTYHFFGLSTLAPVVLNDPSEPLPLKRTMCLSLLPRMTFTFHPPPHLTALQAVLHVPPSCLTERDREGAPLQNYLFPYFTPVLNNQKTIILPEPHTHSFLFPEGASQLPGLTNEGVHCLESTVIIGAHKKVFI